MTNNEKIILKEIRDRIDQLLITATTFNEVAHIDPNSLHYYTNSQKAIDQTYILIELQNFVEKLTGENNG